MPQVVKDSCKHFPRGIPHDEDHRCDAKLVLCGEAPGEREDEAGIGFVGAAGSKLEALWENTAITRADVYMTNVISVRPFNNKLETIPRAEILEWEQKLRQRLYRRLVDPWLVVPAGNLALTALTGLHGIMDYRGSVLTAHFAERHIKAIPVLHPAALLREPYLTKRSIKDWQRIDSDRGFREHRLPERMHVTAPSSARISQFAQRVIEQRDTGVLAVDIETDQKTNKLLCIAFALNPFESLTIPLIGNWANESDKGKAAAYVKAFCESPIKKVLQNGLFDAYHLRFNGVRLNNYYWDTLDLHHALDPYEDHSLALLVSLFTREPFYKHERKEGGKDAKRAQRYDPETLWRYNGKDACCTHEVWQRLVELFPDGQRVAA